MFVHACLCVSVFVCLCTRIFIELTCCTDLVAEEVVSLLFTAVVYIGIKDFSITCQSSSNKGLAAAVLHAEAAEAAAGLHAVAQCQQQKLKQPH